MAIATYGLIGYPLSHSFSPQYFKQKFELLSLLADYKLFPIKNISYIAQVLLSEPELLGLNVTIPHKETIIPFLNEVDIAAAKVGAVNCIQIANGNLIGYNTDIIGFEKSITPLLRTHHKRALILGTGGAAKAIAYVLEKLQIPFLFVSRRKEKGFITYEEIDQRIIASHSIIINTTPVGMHPNTKALPTLPYQYISEQHLLYDLTYNPAETAFLAQGKKNGATTKNGLEMLELQAEASWEIWNA